MDIASRIWDHMEYLSETIGPRPVGSPNHRAAARYIEDQMTRVGVGARSAYARRTLCVRRQVWDCPDWRCEEISLVQGSVALVAAANW